MKNKIMNKLVILVFIMATSMLFGCAKEMKMVGDTTKKADLSKMNYNETTSKSIVDTKGSKMLDVIENNENMTTREPVKEPTQEIVEKEITIVKSTEEDKTKVNVYADLVEEESEDYIERHLTVQEAMDQGYYKYGLSPCRWVYIGPNKQIISNFKPKSSTFYSINKKAMSGSKGCFLPVLSQTKNNNDDYEARFYCFADSTINVEEMKFSNKMSSLSYRGIPLYDILIKGGFPIEETANGLFKVENSYINIVYIDDLDKILGIDE